MTSSSAPVAGVDPEAFEVLERVLAADPSDDEARRRYVEAASALGLELRAAEALKSAIRREKSGEVRERVGLEVAILCLKEGELGLARQAFLDVIVVGRGRRRRSRPRESSSSSRAIRATLTSSPRRSRSLRARRTTPPSAAPRPSVC